MWLPETAVDVETLEMLAENGIRFTILSPHQAKRVRRKGGRSWKDVTGDRIDPTSRVSGQPAFEARRSAFFSTTDRSRRAVAFEGLLNDGETFADRLMSGFSDARDWPQLVAHRHRWRKLRTPSPLRRNGADLRIAAHREQQTGAN